MKVHEIMTKARVVTSGYPMASAADRMRGGLTASW